MALQQLAYRHLEFPVKCDQNNKGFLCVCKQLKVDSKPESLM